MHLYSCGFRQMTPPQHHLQSHARGEEGLNLHNLKKGTLINLGGLNIDLIELLSGGGGG